MHCQVYGGAFWIYSEVLDRRWVQSLCLVLNMCEEILYICLQYIFNICSWQKQERNVSHIFLQLCGVCSKNPRSFQWFAQHEAGHQQSVMEFRNDDLAITPLKFYMETDKKHECLEKVCPFKHCYLGYLCQISGVYNGGKEVGLNSISDNFQILHDVIMSGIWFRTLPLILYSGGLALRIYSTDVLNILFAQYQIFK